MDTSIYTYTPYFYIIQHIESGKFYAGSKYARDANPDNLLKFNGYQTSSKVIKNIILNEGLESFVIRKIKVFETGEGALDYESRFLRRVNASFNDNFLNRCNNSISTLNTDWGKRKKTCLENFGCEFSMQSEIVKEKRKQNTLAKYGVSNSFQVPESQEKYRQNFLKNFGVDNPSKVPEFQEKKKQTYHNLSNRPIVLLIRKYKEKFKLKLGSGWFWKPQEFLDNLLAEIKLTYDLEHPILNSKEKRLQTIINLSNRPTVLLIKKYRDEFKLKLGHNWFCKPQEFLDTLLAEIKLSYDLECPRQILESEEKQRKIIRDLLNQPTISELTKYRDKFKLKLGHNWYHKSQEILDGILAELKLTYGEISENI